MAAECQAADTDGELYDYILVWQATDDRRPAKGDLPASHPDDRRRDAQRSIRWNG